MKLNLIAFLYLAIIISSVVAIERSRQLGGKRRRFRLTGQPFGGRPFKQIKFGQEGNVVGPAQALRAREEGVIDFSEQPNAILTDKDSRKPTKAAQAEVTAYLNKINIESKIPSSRIGGVVSQEMMILGETAVLHCVFDTSAQIGQYSKAQIWWTKQPQRSGDRPIILAAGSQIRLPDDRLKALTSPDNSYSILIIKNTIPEDEGEYKCSLPVVTGTLTKFTKLSLRDTPGFEIDTSSQQLIVAAGDSASFSCDPRDTSVDVWWTAKDEQGNNLVLTRGQNKIYGRTLDIGSVNHRSKGVYTCHVAFEYGNPVRKLFTLQIKEKPWEIQAARDGFSVDSFISQFSPDKEYGSTLQLRCESGGIPIPAIRWYKDDVEVTEGDKYQIMSYEPSRAGQAVFSQLTISDLQPDDEGRYSCQVDNELGNRKKQFTVKGNYRSLYTLNSQQDELSRRSSRTPEEMILSHFNLNNGNPL